MHKEDVYALLFFAAIGVSVPAVIILRQFLGIDIVPYIKTTTVRVVLGTALAALATLIAALNFFLTFVSPWLSRRKQGGVEYQGGISVLPVVGNFCILGAGVLLPRSVALGLYLFALYALDTGGVLWFFILEFRSRG